VTVHLTINNNGMSVFPQAETGDYKATTTFVPTTTDHYTASGQVNAAPKTDEERIYNVYFESCARGEGRDIAKTSSQTHKCSYEYRQANKYSDGTTTTTLYKGDLTFELNSRTLGGSTRFSIDVRQNGWPIASYSEEAGWMGKRQDDKQDCATAQETVNLPRPRVEADQDEIQPLNTGVTADEANSFANADEVARHILIQSLRSGALAEGILSAPQDASKPMDIPGYDLPNGIESLRTGERKAIIGRLQSEGVDSPVVFEAVQTLSRTSGKTGTREYTNPGSAPSRNEGWTP
jgi:hypothetical protein